MNDKPRKPSPGQPPEPLIPKHGGYRHLSSSHFVLTRSREGAKVKLASFAFFAASREICDQLTSKSFQVAQLAYDVIARFQFQWLS